MTRRTRWLVALGIAAAASISAAGRPQNGPGPTLTLSIVGTNDLHGAVVSRDRRGGLEWLGGYLANLRAARSRDGGAVVLVDAGDMFQGTLESNLTEGASVVAAYNALGFHAVAIGNHDLDFGPVGPAATPASAADDARGALKARASEATFPFLAANLIDEVTGRPVSWPNVKPSATVQAGGVTVGLIGVMTSGALMATISANTRGLRVAPLAETIAAEAAQLRRTGADVVVAVAHAGGRCARWDNPRDLSSCDPTDSEIVDVVRTLPRGAVDVVVAGHTHAAMAHDIDGTIVTQAFSNGVAFARADLTIDRRTRAVRGKRVFAPRDICAEVVRGTDRCDAAVMRGRPLVAAEYEGQPVRADASIVAVLAPAVEQARRLKTAPLGVVLETPIRRRGGVESPLGNLFTDAFHAAVPGADVAINNTRGGLRADLPSGPLTYGSLFEAFPFDNRLVRLETTGGGLREIFERQLSEGQTLLGISGLRVVAGCSGGRFRVALVTPSGRAIADDDRLLVVTTDFLAMGGDGVFTNVATDGFAVAEGLPLARDVVADWFRRRGGRLREDQLIDAARPRWEYPGGLPVRCA
jgi:5'-nucleotidase